MNSLQGHDPQNPGGQGSPLDVWRLLISKQDALFEELTDQNLKYQKRMRDLEDELSGWKRAVRDCEKTEFGLQAEIDKLREENGRLKLGNPLVVCLIDGDGVIFSEDLIGQGREGGREAATKLSQEIRNFINSGQASTGNPPPNLFQLYVVIYFNATGLSKILSNNNICSEGQLTEFMEGFNQANPLFTMVDVGRGKEAADAKLKESLRLFIKLPQTRHVIFGGAHDSGYLHELRSFQTDGLLEKLIVLKGNYEVAYEVKQFVLEKGIPLLGINDILLQRRPTNSQSRSYLTAAAREGPNLLSPPLSPVAVVPRPRAASRAGSIASSALDEGTSRPSKPPGLRTVLNVNPSKPIEKQDPKLCSNFYLAGNCINGVGVVRSCIALSHSIEDELLDRIIAATPMNTSSQMPSSTNTQKS
ncbi:hypothetical protein FRC03_002235 [Tulasnella sp. 419]|nr:hypothetical protein FRC03_002235 [Tulasnella sp. 419]